jgi:calcium-translocating P-type ATPase
MREDGSILSFRARELEKRLREMTAKGYRVILITLSQDGREASSYESGISGVLTLIGAVCLGDPIREEAAISVAKLQDAGVQVVMITGDNRETAQNIALRCGILNKQCDLILTGEELSQLSDLRLIELLPRLAVVARALPTDKSRLVRLAQEVGLVTGMTGDGINDAPALRRADIGFAMGSGTQVAKDAGDIIILDNNLASIVRAVLYGRTIFKSIRKFITLQLTMNFCAMGVTMICPFLGIDSPVTVVQMLWINMIMDTLGGLAFAGEAPRDDYMKEAPKRRNEPILNRYMINQILLLGGFTVGLCLFFLKSPTVTRVFRPHPNNLYLLTAFFALFIFSSVFNCFHARTDRLKLSAGLKKNPVFLAIMIVILIIQLLFVYVGGSVLRTAPLTLRELVVTFAISLSVFPAELIRKILLRLLGKRNGY